ncbi:hypothetical protein ACFL6M_00835 [Candidatus Eisenbacteria bacterium]|uniref:Uncharacterized protein n=1 Tax=Eiseniibacteriota bacterium TaxID=2212470 RepID=A0ABV6YIF8_UNCEI
MNRSQITSGKRLLMVGIGLVLVLSWIAIDFAAAGEVTKRTKRNIRIMEEIISDVLVESPYWLVSSGGPTTGVYVDGFGVLFTFEASLVSGSSYGKHRLGFLKDFTFIWNDDEDDDEYYDDDDEDLEDDEAYAKWRERRKKKASKCYAGGKEELREVLLDCDDIFTELAASDHIVIAAALDDNRYFRKNKLSRLVMKVRVSDLRAFEAGSINETELASRLLEEEY